MIDYTEKLTFTPSLTVHYMSYCETTIQNAMQRRDTLALASGCRRIYEFVQLVLQGFILTE